MPLRFDFMVSLTDESASMKAVVKGLSAVRKGFVLHLFFLDIMFPQLTFEPRLLVWQHGVLNNSTTPPSKKKGRSALVWLDTRRVPGSYERITRLHISKYKTLQHSLTQDILTNINSAFV